MNMSDKEQKKNYTLQKEGKNKDWSRDKLENRRTIEKINKIDKLFNLLRRKIQIT